MAAKLKDDDVQFGQTLTVDPRGLKKLAEAVRAPKKPTPALIKLMAGKYDARRPK